MKRIIAAALIAASLTGCGSNLYTPTKVYPTYGIANEQAARSSKVCYKLIMGNLVWAIVGIENVIMPIYFIGFSIMEPVRMKKDEKDNCLDSIDD